MPAPWTFTCPHCAGPAFHSIAIPRTSEAARALIAGGGLDDLEGRSLPVDADGFALCGTCFVTLTPSPLVFAAMTVEANWRRREDPAPAAAAPEEHYCDAAVGRCQFIHCRTMRPDGMRCAGRSTFL